MKSNNMRKNGFHQQYEVVKTKISNLKNLPFDQLATLFYSPTDPSSLGIIRFLFGFLMIIDICEERGGSEIHIRWGDPNDCHFPLFRFLQPLSYPYMSILYGVMWLGAFGIMIGYKFRLSIFLFGVPYWYLLLIDKSFWNNHSYLYGLVTILLMGSSSNHFWSVDSAKDKSIHNAHVPYWNYFIIKYQFFMLYFLAGLKKTDMEWLDGYSMTEIGRHWVFIPFRILLTTEQIDYLIVHWFGFLLDLTIGFWMLLEYTRPVAMLFCACFHLMNSRLFSIGMFPYVCLATMPLFCEETWPRKIQNFFLKENVQLKPNINCIYSKEDMKFFKDKKLSSQVKWKHRLVTVLLLSHCGLQAFLPYSHFITKGYNNWTNGLYGYSWDMMVHSWDTILVVVKVVDNNSGEEYFLDPNAWTLNDRWSKHADMCLQYAQCLKKNLPPIKGKESSSELQEVTPDNISIYIDVWCSLNGRFQQRMYDPNYDLLRARWSPFEKVEWLLPLLSDYNSLRKKMKDISRDVLSWSNYSDILFIADYPGMYLENYVSEELRNVTLTVLEGEVFYEVEDETKSQSFGLRLTNGASYPVEVGIFHKIHTVSKTPSCYMYTFINTTNERNQETFQRLNLNSRGKYSPFPLIEDIPRRAHSFSLFFKHVLNGVTSILLNREFYEINLTEHN